MSLCLEQLYALLNERFDARLVLDIVRRVRTGTALENYAHIAQCYLCMLIFGSAMQYSIVGHGAGGVLKRF